MRLLTLQRLIFSAFLFLWLALFTTQVIHGPTFRRQAEKNRTRLIPLPAARGSIVDRNSVPLVEDQMGFELAVLPHEVKNLPKLWERLAPLVHLSVGDLASRYRRGYEAPFAPVPLVRNVPPETAFLLEERRDGLAGTFIRPMPQRRYLLGPALGPTVGYVGLISAEELTNLKPYGYTIRDYVGRDGLEHMYDPALRGKDGGLQVEVDARGKMIRELGYLKPISGRRITVSLDSRLQSACYRLMADKAGAIVVMDARNGEILSLVSAPSFDPNVFVDPQRRSEVRHYLHSVGRPMFNRAIRANVPPGSTFKAAVAYGALRAHKIQPETTVICPGTYQLGTATFHCWFEPGHGPQTVTDALAHSCNVFFYNTARWLGAEQIAQTARFFGLGHKTGIDLPMESAGLVPDPTWMKNTLHREWQPGDTLSFGIGQSALNVTPLQMLLLFTAIAGDGTVPSPHLLLSLEGESSVPPPPSTPLFMDSEALSTVKRGLEQVVSSSTGTGRLAQFSGGMAAAGKTGTAQAPQGLSHAWFCGYVPANQPAYSFVVFLEHGGKGGEQAALVAHDLLVHLKEFGYL